MWCWEVPKKEIVPFGKSAAIAGHPSARTNLGYYGGKEGRVDRAIKHWIIAANLGEDTSIQSLKECYQDGDVSKDDFALALRANQAAVDATKSPQREAALVKRSMTQLLFQGGIVFHVLIYYGIITHNNTMRLTPLIQLNISSKHRLHIFIQCIISKAISQWSMMLMMLRVTCVKFTTLKLQIHTLPILTMESATHAWSKMTVNLLNRSFALCSKRWMYRLHVHSPNE